LGSYRRFAAIGAQVGVGSLSSRDHADRQATEHAQAKASAQRNASGSIVHSAHPILRDPMARTILA